MSRLPKEIRKGLKKEGKDWKNTIAKEDAEQVQELLDAAEPFRVSRPARQPVSIRMDLFDIAMIKRLARKKGIPHSQLIALWLHERVEQEKKLFVSK